VQVACKVTTAAVGRHIPIGIRSEDYAGLSCCSNGGECNGKPQCDREEGGSDEKAPGSRQESGKNSEIKSGWQEGGKNSETKGRR